MPVAIDLAIMKIKSLKRYLAEMAEMPEAIEQVARAICGWSRRDPEALEVKQQHDRYMAVADGDASRW